MNHNADALAPSVHARVIAALDELTWRLQVALQNLGPQGDPTALSEVPITTMALSTLQVPLAWERRVDILEDLLRLQPFHAAAPERPPH